MKIIKGHQLMKAQFRHIQWQGAMAEAFGHPEDSGMWLVWGASGNGKTAFVLRLAQALIDAGDKVLFNSLEEGARSTLKQARHRRLYNNVPLLEDELERLCKVMGLACVQAVDLPTFEQFYEAYGCKEGRKKAEAAWNRLPKAEQLKAYRYIPRLKAKKMQSGEALPYPATYLNQKRWED